MCYVELTWVLPCVRVLATSQMQATFARKAFPCFDEPAMKATFSVVLIHPQGTGALSNSKQMGGLTQHCDIIT